MKKTLLILVVLAVIIFMAPQAIAAGGYCRHYGGWGIFIPIPAPPIIILPPNGYYGGHWETRWEWDPYSQRWYQIKVWVDHYPYYDEHPRRYHPHRW
jgi:hypothetical protein